MQRHRIFIAINLPENIKQKLVEYQKKIEESFTPHRPAFSGTGARPIKWTKIENLHITLDFIGYINNDELLDVCKIVKETAFKQPPFLINLTKICYGPTDKKLYSETSSLTGRPAISGNRPPKMIWAMGEKSKKFAFLKDDLDKSLSGSEKASFSAENRAFSPHITLGRIKQWEWKQIEPEERPVVNEDISLNFSVNSIEVMESILKRKGPEYIILESHNLES